MTAVAPPPAPSVPTYPALGSPTFNTEAYTYGTSMPGVSTGIKALADNAYANAQSAFTDATNAASAQAAAVAASNFKGNWSSLSGALNIPASVAHSGRLWLLLQNLANVATQTPGSAPTYWMAIPQIIGDAVGAVNYLKGSDVASATTPDIWSAGGNLLNITGTTTTTGFAAAPQAGAHRVLRAAGAWPLTHGANLILPGSANYTCSAGDVVTVHALTTTQFFVTITKADGTPVQNRDGRVLLSSVTASSTSLVAFTSVLTSTYEAYDIELINVVPAVTSAVLRLHTSSNGGSSYAVSSGDYMVNLLSSTVSTPTPSGYGSITDTYIALHAGSVDNTSSQGGVSGVIRVTNPAGGTAKKVIQGQTTAPANSSTDYVQTLISAVRNSSSAVNGIQISFQNGNIASGIVRIYGIKK